jgi:hypothetical protein
MEPSGRNQWQPVANGTALKTAHPSETLAVGCDGKEGVDGSSPSEGFEGSPAIAGLLSSRAATHSALRVRDGYTRLSRCPRRRLFSPSQRRALRLAPTAPPRIVMLFLAARIFE